MLPTGGDIALDERMMRRERTLLFGSRLLDVGRARARWILAFEACPKLESVSFHSIGGFNDL